MKKLTVTLLLLLILTLPACAPGTHTAPANASQATRNGSAGGSVTRALTSEPTSLDPQGIAGSGQNVIFPYLFDTLVYRDVDNSYQPFLAESWQIAPDGRSVTFKLRQDVKFTDGTPLNADAVVFTFERFKKVGAKSPIAAGVMSIDAIQAVDPFTVEFSFKQPSSTFFGTISMPYAGILSPAAVQSEGEAFAQKPVGTGPFMLSHWEPGVSITLDRNPNYHWAPKVVKNQAAPYIQQAIFKVIPDPAAQLAALQKGEVDVVFVNQPDQIERLRQDSNLNLIDATLNSLIYLGFNCKKAPFDQAEVRQALAHAVNKPELVKTVLNGTAEPAFAPLAPTLPGYDASLQQDELGFDLTQTNTLLSKAGFSRGPDGTWLRNGEPFKVTLLTSTRAPNGDLATLLQSQFKAAGISVEVKQLEAQAAMAAFSKGDYDLMLWRYDWNDADVLSIYLGSSQIGKTNRNFYSNPAVDELLEQAMHEMDTKARAEMYLEAQKVILSDAVWQPLYVPKDVIVARKTLKNVVMGPMGRMLLNDVRVQ